MPNSRVISQLAVYLSLGKDVNEAKSAFWETLEARTYCSQAQSLSQLLGVAHPCLQMKSSLLTAFPAILMYLEPGSQVTSTSISSISSQQICSVCLSKGRLEGFRTPSVHLYVTRVWNSVELLFRSLDVYLTPRIPVHLFWIVLLIDVTKFEDGIRGTHMQRILAQSIWMRNKHSIIRFLRGVGFAMANIGCFVESPELWKKERLKEDLSAHDESTVDTAFAIRGLGQSAKISRPYKRMVIWAPLVVQTFNLHDLGIEVCITSAGSGGSSCTIESLLRITDVRISLIHHEQWFCMKVNHRVILPMLGGRIL